ncbi:hypothetical protein FJ941_05870 [Mesorhizobium sp. B2-3-13]|uniref:hypothetical protein n=1 Tax=Mesorhizobium sp. B2-3-13 TaxID=2589951 RepID=UPI00112A6137|nr:hypothetical protein [Mesorhizobium sp. B2-3-13]TPL88418.1 hypothetical protein FJ941_05870 [Mesorhizobium sp. B2-3-13]
MNYERRSNSASAPLGDCPDRVYTIAALFHDGLKQYDDRKRSRAAPLRLIPFCLMMLLGFAAVGLAPLVTKPPVAPTQIVPPDGGSSESAAAEQRQALGWERSWVDALRRGLTAARRESEATRAEALASQVRVKGEHDQAERERAASEQSFLTLHKDIDDIDALKTGSAHGENLPREPAAARQELAATRRVIENASAPSRAVADPMNQPQPALEAQRQKADGLPRDLAQPRLSAEAVARDTAERSLAEARQTLEEERRKVGLLERDIAGARQSIEALEAGAKLAATTRAGAIQGRQLAEVAARQAGDALAQERERANALASDLETARREGDAATEELTRISTAFNEAAEQERKKAIDLARDLASARKDIEALKRWAERCTSHIENAAKALPTDRASAHAPRRRSLNRGQQEVGNAGVPKSRVVRLTTITLPDALLPTRPPAEGFSQ